MPDAGRPKYLSFDRVAHDYDESRYLPDHVADAVAAEILRDVSDHDWFLDAGVGTGRYGRALARRHARTAGVDVSHRMMRELLRRGGSERAPHLARADLRRLPFPDAAFGGVLAVHVFHLIADWRLAVEEVWRVLRSGGALFLVREGEAETRVRDDYLRRAAERGALPPNLGARTGEVIAALARKGAAITDPGPPTLYWERVWSPRRMLEMLERRAYSLLWDVPDDLHRALLGETRAWAIKTLGSLDAEERVRTDLTLFQVRKP